MQRKDYHAGRWHFIARRWPLENHGRRFAVDLWSNPLWRDRWTLDVCAGQRMWTLRRSSI